MDWLWGFLWFQDLQSLQNAQYFRRHFGILNLSADPSMTISGPSSSLLQGVGVSGLILRETGCLGVQPRRGSLLALYTGRCRGPLQGVVAKEVVRC